MCAGLAPELEQASSFVGRWMDILRPGYQRVAARVAEPEARRAALEQEAVLTSLRNLGTFPFVAEAVAAGVLTLHGAFVDIGTGTLMVYRGEAGFVAI
jgi:carbonic anhydrase